MRIETLNDEAVNLDVKKTNKSRVYQFLYKNDGASLKEMTLKLDMSMPTLLQNIKELKAEQLITEIGSYESSRGRKPKILGCNYNVKYAIGVDITKNHIVMAMINLKGEINNYVRMKQAFKNSPSYFKKLEDFLNDFLEKAQVSHEKILGAGISLPGIMDAQMKRMQYGKVIDFEGGDLENFRKVIPFPCYFCNDANAGGFAEMWHTPDIDDMIYLSLSNTVGGAVLVNGQLYFGKNQKSGEFGHMTIRPGGKKCYCGRKGCADVYCSAKVVERDYEDLNMFFESLEREEETAVSRWKEYREDLCLQINNLRLSFDAPIVLGGYVGSYLEKYLEDLRSECQKTIIFESEINYIRTCYFKLESSAVGAALFQIKNYIDGI